MAMEDLTAGQHDLNKATDWKAWTAADIPRIPPRQHRIAPAEAVPKTFQMELKIRAATDGTGGSVFGTRLTGISTQGPISVLIS